MVSASDGYLPRGYTFLTPQTLEIALSDISRHGEDGDSEPDSDDRQSGEHLAPP
jgi:hypothetical protein